MTPRKYPKGLARTEEILEVALQVVAAKGYGRATVRELADAAGLSTTGLLHHFGTKEALFAEILRRRDAVDADRAGASTDGATPGDGRLADLPRIAASEPGLVQLYARFSAEATDVDHAAHDFFRERYVRSRAHLTAVLQRSQHQGRLPAQLDAARVATALIAALDGLQLQWLYDDDVDTAGAFEALLAAVGLDDATQP